MRSPAFRHLAVLHKQLVAPGPTAAAPSKGVSPVPGVCRWDPADHEPGLTPVPSPGLVEKLNAMRLPEPSKPGINMDIPRKHVLNPEEAVTNERGLLIFQNERVRVWDNYCDKRGPDGLFTGGCTGWHHHEFDYVFMNVHGCNNGENGTVIELIGKNGKLLRVDKPNPILETVVTFNAVQEDFRAVPRIPHTHNVWNASDTGRLRQIEVDFLDEKPKRTEAEFKAMLEKAQAAGYNTDLGTKLIFENHRCRIWDFSLAPHSGADLPFRMHTTDYFFVATNGGPDHPGEKDALQGLRGWTGPGMPARQEGAPQNMNFRAADRDTVYQEVPNGGFDEKGVPLQCEKVWNHLDVPYHSFVVELK